jgi:AIR synthase-related protein
MKTAHQLCEQLLSSRGFVHKRDITQALSVLHEHSNFDKSGLRLAVPNGDDCAAIEDGHGGYLLYAIEGLVEDFIQASPWFAGYCSVMVNVSDIYAMGGNPTAVVNAIWSHDPKNANQVLNGMLCASQKYGVPIVGGHSNYQSNKPQLAVSILGHAKNLLSSFDAKTGDALIMVFDLRGKYEDPYPYWNASTLTESSQLIGDLSLLTKIANSGLCKSAKDISMAGAIGTALMLLECSKRGATIDVEAIPKPEGVDDLKWLTSFPSYGFILSVPQSHVREVLELFGSRQLSAQVVGQVTLERQVHLIYKKSTACIMDFETQQFIGA